jgi:pimeloyl-ACP methyl ester carboxylesterase
MFWIIYAIEKTHMVGISLGTIIIREIAELFPHKVDKLVMGGAILNFNLRGKILMKIGDWL